MKEFLEFMRTNWGWIVAAFSVFFEISPIKFSPISSICKWTGKRLTDDIKKDINNINKRLDKQEKEINLLRMSNIRSLVLDFANSCRNGIRHSREEFCHVMAENAEYQNLVEKYNVTNDVYKEDYKFVLDKYRECLDNNSFLS